MPEVVQVEPSKTIVLTSENSAEFYANKLGLPKPEAKVEVEAKPEAKAEEATPAKQEEQAKEPEEKQEKHNGFQERISELTAKRRAAEARAEEAERKAQEADRKAKELEAKLNPPKADTKPSPDQFQDAFKYAEALAEWSVKDALKQRDKAESDAKEAAARQEVINGWVKRENAFKAQRPDYQEIIAESPVQVSNPIRDAIIESDVGPQLLLYFAENPEEAEKIGKMTITAGLKRLGKIEDKLAEPKAESKTEPKKEEVKKVEIKSVPEPITPIKSLSSPMDIPIDSNGEFTGTPAEYRALRKAGKIK